MSFLVNKGIYGYSGGCSLVHGEKTGGTVDNVQYVLAVGPCDVNVKGCCFFGTDVDAGGYFKPSVVSNGLNGCVAFDSVWRVHA